MYMTISVSFRFTACSTVQCKFPGGARDYTIIYYVLLYYTILHYSNSSNIIYYGISLNTI